MESFAADFPRIYVDSSFKGWFVSALLIFAWAGSLINGPIADSIGRKGSMIVAVVIFTIGSVFQTAANSVPLLFAGKQTLRIVVSKLCLTSKKAAPLLALLLVCSP